MKALYKSALVLCSVLLLAACGGKVDPVDPGENQNQKEEVKPETRTLTFKLPATSVSGKTKWVAGDKIVVHGEYAAQQVTVTLAAGDISSDGKTATLSVDNLYPYVREDVASTLYAGYPAEAVDNLKHCFFYTKFNNTNAPLMAACNGAGSDEFKFVDLCAAVTFTVSADVDGFSFYGNKKESVGYGQYQVKITPETQNYIQYTSDPILTIEGKLSGGKGVVYIPNGLNLEKGFTLKLKKGEEVVKYLKATDEVELTHGVISDLGDISAEIEDYVNPFSADVKDLDTKGSANCYIVTEPGKYKFLAVKGNNRTAFFEDIDDAKVLWETWNDDSEVEANSVVKSVSYTEDYMILEMPATLHPGNAVVAAMDSEGVIVWSWHIWVPETAIVTKNYGILTPDMMDRNLGALVAAEAGVPSPIHSFGLTYQWGRKDPFVGPKAVKSGDNATVAGVELSQTEGAGAADECKITLEQSIANPTLLGHSQNGSWIIPEGNDLWSDTEKTIYDPCPPGYRVPARESGKPFHSGDLTTQVGWSESVDNAQFTLGDPVAVFPLAGYRDDYGPDGMTHAYDRAVYWTAYASGDAKTGYYVNVRSPGSKHALGEAGKSRAGSVRCVVE
jgi:hypothetical protein